MVGENLNKFLKIKKITAKELAKKIFLTESTVSRLLNGSIENPKSQVLRQLAETYNLNIHWLITGKGEMVIDDPISNELVSIYDQTVVEEQKKIINQQTETIEKLNETLNIQGDKLDKMANTLKSERDQVQGILKALNALGVEKLLANQSIALNKPKIDYTDSDEVVNS